MRSPKQQIPSGELPQCWFLGLAQVVGFPQSFLPVLVMGPVARQSAGMGLLGCGNTFYMEGLRDVKH